MNLVKRLCLLATFSLATFSGFCQQEADDLIRKDASEFELLKGKQILYIERTQYPPDHHNTGTLFVYGEVNQKSFSPGAAMRIYDVDSKKITTLLESKDGVIRDPELSYDATKIVFSMRNDIKDSYHIYEINVDGSGLKQLTFSQGTDIDPVYLPEGDIIFSSTRQPKYCMCNRHIMANLYRMEGDGANINQIGVSTLFEGHSTVLEDGRILYDRWEYVDRNFGDAQGLWTVNPDGTKHTIFYGNNTPSPGGVIDARQIPGTDLMVCVFSSCHDRPWGALAIIDRKMGVDGKQAVVDIMPAYTIDLMDKKSWDAFRGITYCTEDPWPLSQTQFLAASTKHKINKTGLTANARTGLFYMDFETQSRYMILESEKQSLFEPMIIEPRKVPLVIPTNRNHTDSMGTFYVQNVYEGTHMEGVEPGSVKYLRVIQSPEKRSWTSGTGKWAGQGSHFPAINWHSFEVKHILGDVEVMEDGSANFKAPAGIHIYFQVLDKDKKMIQSMRSGISLMPGEVNGCIGCHEDRLSVPVPTARPEALKKAPVELTLFDGRAPHNFSYMEEVQPIWDKHCVSCHDFDINEPNKLVLAGDKNMFFNASYINLYVKGALKLIGGGPAETAAAYSWGSYKSKLATMIEARHKKVKLSKKEMQTVYTWLDLNGVYYPTYETAFYDIIGGRSPLTKEETAELTTLTGVNFAKLAGSSRKAVAQVSFERPELSPCLASIRDDKAKYDRAIEILKSGAEQLKKTPRGDIEKDLVMHPIIKAQIDNYNRWMGESTEAKQNLSEGVTFYDAR